MSTSFDDQLAAIQQANSRPSLASKLIAVMGAVQYIQKDKRNEFHKYTYASEAAIKEKLHAALLEQRVLFVPLSAKVIETRQSASGKETITTVDYAYAFIDGDTGERIEGHFPGCGSDASDKGVYKAITGAIKYILTSTFLIPTGDDPETEERGTKKAQRDTAAEKIRKLRSEARARGVEVFAKPDDDPTDPTEAVMDEVQALGDATEPEPPMTNAFADMLAAFQKAKIALGREEYYRILGQHGVEKSNEIRSVEKGNAILAEMRERVKEMKARAKKV